MSKLEQLRARRDQLQTEVIERKAVLAEERRNFEFVKYGSVRWRNQMEVVDLPCPLSPDFDIGYRFEDSEGNIWESCREPGQRRIFLRQI